VEILLLGLGLALAAVYAMGIGANDTANSIAGPVGGGVLKYRSALLVFSISVLLGAILQGHMVMKTLGKGVVSNLDIYGAVSASLAALIWVYIASYLGLPVSTSQSATGGVIGVGLAMIILGQNTKLNLDVVSKIIISWTISPLLAIALTAILYIVLERVFSRVKIGERGIRGLAILASAWDGYAFGANDVANATGVYYAIVGSTTFFSSLDSRFLLTLYGALFIILGGVLLGRRVVETMAYKITKLDPIGSLSSSIISASSTWIFTTIPYMLFGYGMPISTTYISVGTIIGAGIGRHRSIRQALNLKLVLGIILSWFLTLPTSATLSMGFYYLFTKVFLGM